MGLDRVNSAPSMDLDPIWYPTLDDLKISRNKKSSMTMFLRRSARIRTQQERSRVENTSLPPPRLLNDVSDLVLALVTLELQPVGSAPSEEQSHCSRY
jgi:hypothetical protein